MAILRVSAPGSNPFERRLEKSAMVVGRSSRADLLLPDRALSREHARLYEMDGGWFVEDLGSRNGTFVNGMRISQPHALSDGDVLTLGGCRIVFQTTPGGPPPSRDAEDLGQHTVFVSASELLKSSSATRPVAETKDEAALRRYAERLRVLNEVHQALGRSIALNELLGLILDRAFEHLKPEHGAIFLREPSGEYRRAAYRTLRPNEEELVVSRSLVREVVEKGLAAIVLDARTDERFAEAASLMNVGLRSLVAAPLLDPQGAVGMIVLGSKVAMRQFTEDDAELLVSLASVAALRLRNVALAEEAAERRLLESEVALARRIQVALLPDRLPELSGWELHAGNIPSRGVSGDYYEVVPRKGGGEVVFLIADVSGKGMAASLLTASLEALTAGPIEDGLPPEEICTRVSRLLFQRTPPEKYATVFVAALEPASGRLRYANGGHNPGLVVRAGGSVEWLGSTGTPVGILPAAVYRAGELSLQPGDLFVLYTDGITEANNPEEEEYGGERLAALCGRHPGTSLKDLAVALERDLEGFTRGVPFADDRTVVMVRRGGA
jgi:sigma-B regulation protein RsbU (phosphoserine phosphatase)